MISVNLAYNFLASYLIALSNLYYCSFASNILYFDTLIAVRLFSVIRQFILNVILSDLTVQVFLNLSLLASKLFYLENV